MERGKPSVYSLKVSAPKEGMTLLLFLKEKALPKLSNRQIKRLIDDKACLVNNRTEKFASYLVKKGDEITLTLKEEEDLPVLYEDPYFFVVNKPAGLLFGSKQFLALLGKRQEYYFVHRLDKETSGVLLIAKKKRVESLLLKAFKDRKIEKVYLALVEGEVLEERREIRSFIGKVSPPKKEPLFGNVSSSRGKYALTHFEKLVGDKKSTLLLCSPKTGRTHQIRLHLSKIGHPILGDDRYGARSKMNHHLLHAYSLVFTHPITSRPFSVKAPLPPLFQRELKKRGWR